MGLDPSQVPELLLAAISNSELNRNKWGETEAAPQLWESLWRTLARQVLIKNPTGSGTCEWLI